MTKHSYLNLIVHQVNYLDSKLDTFNEFLEVPRVQWRPGIVSQTGIATKLAF